MTAGSEAAGFAPANDAELRTLETAWTEGKLRAHADRLLEFIDRHRSDILLLAGAARDGATLLQTVKLQIVQHGSVCSVSEMRDQARAIRDEIWIRGERGEYDRAHITHEWTSRHAANWRRWRLKEYVFVVERCAPELLALLHGATPTVEPQPAPEAPRPTSGT